MSIPYLEVIASDGSRQLGEIAQERVIVGSSPTSHVVVDLPEIARAHLLLSPRPEGCYVAAARDAQIPVVYNNQIVDRTIVPWGSELSIGSARFIFHDGSVPQALFLALPPGDIPRAPHKAGLSPIVIIACIVAIPAAGWMLLQTPEEDVPRSSAQPPPLFDEIQMRPCPQRDPLQAFSLATEVAHSATTENTRLPFHYQDGIAAVNDYTLAAGCYQTAGDTARAEAQMASARAMAERLYGEYSNHRYRLERALKEDKTEDALIEVRLIKNLLAHRRGPYPDWLAALERRLEVKLEEAEKQAQE